MEKSPSFTQLKKLEYLWISGSNLNGEIPDTIGKLEALVHLDLSKNNLTGKIPSNLFMPKNLSIVCLFRNQLSGEIPRVVEALNIDVIEFSGWMSNVSLSLFHFVFLTLLSFSTYSW